MGTQDIYEKLGEIFEEVFDRDDLEVSAELSADQVEEWDSLSHIRLIISCEVAFGIKFDTTEVSELAKVADLVSLIESKL